MGGPLWADGAGCHRIIIQHLWGLLARMVKLHPDQAALLREDPDQWKRGAAEEVLRMRPGFYAIGKKAVRDVEAFGTPPKWRGTARGSLEAFGAASRTSTRCRAAAVLRPQCCTRRGQGLPSAPFKSIAGAVAILRCQDGCFVWSLQGGSGWLEGPISFSAVAAGRPLSPPSRIDVRRCVRVPREAYRPPGDRLRKALHRAA